MQRVVTGPEPEVVDYNTSKALLNAAPAHVVLD